MIADKIGEVKKELALLEAVQQDFVVNKFPVINMRTDAVYEMFCQRHPDVEVSQRRFTWLLTKELGFHSKQSWLDGMRGSFYE